MARPSQSRIDALVLEQSRLTGGPMSRTYVSVADIRGNGTTRKETRPRWLVWRTLWLDGFGFYPIAQAWGCHHTTIIHAKRMNWGLPVKDTAPLTIWGRAAA